MGMKEKIGIVTELNLEDVNFGNYLQSYALNHYLRMEYPEKEVETLLLPRRHEARIYASTFWWFMITLRRCYTKLKKIILPQNKGKKIDTRFEKFIQFARNNININDKLANWTQLKASDYKIMIVGSDVVWQQSRGCIRKAKFLYFDRRQGTEEVMRVAYAASFGINFIPKENIKSITKCLSKFKAISVREKSAVKMLESIGIKGVIHVCDSTLLLKKEQWIEIEKEPYGLVSSLKDISHEKCEKKYCFAYMLGQDETQRKAIIDFCKRKGLCLVTVPYINGYMQEGLTSSKNSTVRSRYQSGNLGFFQDCFGDIQVMDCSPQEWIWLIHHAEYVITDSFHGLIFSTIFSTKYIIMKRAWKIDMNIRLQDYLALLDEGDKCIGTDELDRLNEFTWDFETIHKKMDTFIMDSKKYLKKALSDV